MRALLRAPALHFLVLGALLFAGLRIASVEAADQLAGLEGPARDEELLVRAAVARGWLETDPVVRSRLERNAAFLGGASAEEQRQLAQSDLVVRRRLVQRMRAELEAAGRAEPSEVELAARFQAQHARLEQPARARVTQVFFAPGHPTPALDGVAPADAPRLGDPFLLGHDFAAASETELAAIFGPELARAAFVQAPGEWSAPLASSFGTHRIWVHERTPARPATLAGARATLLAELREARAAAAYAAGLRALRETGAR